MDLSQNRVVMLEIAHTNGALSSVLAIPLRAIILDWSGTLVDDLDAVHRTTNWVLAECGRPALSREAFRQEFCLPISRFYTRHAPGQPMEHLSALFWRKFPEFIDDIRLLPCAKDFLEFCAQRGILTILATSIDRRTYETLARRWGLETWLRHAYTGLENKVLALPDIVWRHNLPPKQTIFVGDMEHDLEAGQAAGVLTCALLNGYTPAQRLLAKRPDLACVDLCELEAALRSAYARKDSSAPQTPDETRPFP